jgi:predicted TIM-barrel fold metal-dependent hydrolase
MLKPFCGCDVSRRSFLGGVAGLGASALLPAQAADPTVQGNKNRIDTHHHFFSPGLNAAMTEKKVIQAPAINWSLQKTLDDMDAAGTATSILSATTPQVSFLDEDFGKKMARENNEYAAKIRGDHKGRFGSFAMLPMKNMDDALREMEYALDVLKAEGIGLLTSYGDKWLGHPMFAPVMQELNRRGAILYTHPTSANCCNNLIPNTPPTVVEYGTDTTRTIVDIVFSGTAAKNPNIKFIFSHAGGTLPFLTERLEKMPVIDPKLKEKVPNGVLHELKRFYYDTAWAANQYTIPSLLQLVSKDQILFGSDYPYRTSEDNIKGLIKYGFNDSDMNQITRGNALKLMPKLAKA